MKRVVIVGGGITGLATAVHLRDRAGELEGGLEVLVLEAADRPGGNIRTDRVDGFTIEQGPNGFLDNVPATLAMVRRLGLEPELQPADERAAKRFLFRDGRLHLLPSGPVSFLRSRVLSVRGRLRVLGEPFARSRPSGVDESVFDFAARRIGPEAAAILVDAMVSGVFAGNARELSLRSAFPKMAKMEEEHGGLVRAMVALGRQRRRLRRQAAEREERGEDVTELTRPGGPAGPGGTLTSFRNGLDTLVDSLAAEVGDSLRAGQPVTDLERAGEGQPAPWVVRLATGVAVDADAVILALPAPGAVPLLRGLDPALAEPVQEIGTAGLVVVALGFRAEEAGDLDGFGLLVPRGTGPRILGCLWDSSIFPGRAPAGHALLRVMIGGAHDPGAVAEADDALIGQVRADLRTTMGLAADPVLVRIYRWPRGIAQYRPGHQERLDRVHERLRHHPGLWVAGSSYYGIAMNACFDRAPALADAVLARLRG
jgi:protoporphyrinogen/coproporphyrinogen III oxidase